MNLETEFAYIDEYFSNISKEDLIRDLYSCGLGVITSPEDVFVASYIPGYSSSDVYLSPVEVAEPCTVQLTLEQGQAA